MSRSVLAFALAGLAGCGESRETQLCTLVGCSSGLQVDLESTAVPFRIEARVPGSSSHYVAECTERAPCTTVFFEDFTPASVRLQLIAEGDTARWLAEPVYVAERPNGPNCPPVCRIGRVRVPATPNVDGP
jgi:hypothetical protein